MALEFTSASRQRIWWQVHSPRNKWTLNVQEFARLTWQVQLTGACKRIETDQQLQLQTHGCKCQMLPRAPSIQRIHNNVLLLVQLCTWGKKHFHKYFGNNLKPHPKTKHAGSHPLVASCNRLLLQVLLQQVLQEKELGKKASRNLLSNGHSLILP